MPTAAAAAAAAAATTASAASGLAAGEVDNANFISVINSTNTVGLSHQA